MSIKSRAVDYESPLGPLRIYFIEGFIDRVALQPSSDIRLSAPELPKSVRRFLDNYFAKRPTPIKPQWFRPTQSAFAESIYTALQSVKFGAQISYGELAIKAGYTSQYARAVGQAMNKNPWPIFVPCHRVINNKGDLGGFSAGIEVKEALLRHEGFERHPTLHFNSRTLPRSNKARHVS